MEKVFRIIVQLAMQPDQEQNFISEGKCFDDEYVRPWSTKVYAAQRIFLERISETLRHSSIDVNAPLFLCRFRSCITDGCAVRFVTNQVTVQRLIDFVAAKGDSDVIFKQIRCKSGGACTSGLLSALLAALTLKYTHVRLRAKSVGSFG